MDLYDFQQAAVDFFKDKEAGGIFNSNFCIYGCNWKYCAANNSYIQLS